MPHVVIVDDEPAARGLTAKWLEAAGIHFRVAAEIDHAQRVASMSVRLAELLGLPEPERADLHKAALLHDVARVVLPVELFEGAETPSVCERPVMAGAPSFAHGWLKSVPLRAGAAEIIGSIAEWYDGSGLPEGRFASDIPIGSRVLSVADMFDQLRHPQRSRQPGHYTRPVQEVLLALDLERGDRFDPNVLDALVKLLTVN